MAKSEDSVFDDIVHEIGDHGKFQKRFNFWFNLVLVVFAGMPYLNIIIALSIPDHWCYVPGRNLTNSTIEEWKMRTLPKERDPKGIESFSKCKMYNVSVSDDIINTIECQHGWEFDRTWYDLTAPSQQSWVCDKELYVTNTFVFCKIGEIVGTFIFGQVGDTYGRKPVFYVTLITITLGRCLSGFTSDIYSLFLFAAFFGSLASSAVFQSPLVIAMEISRGEDRAGIAMLQCIGWTAGLCVMPMIMWWLGHWSYFMLATTLPCVAFLFGYRLMIESPRWLASKGKFTECVKVLKKIANANGTSLHTEDVMLRLKKSASEKETVYGVISLFSSWRLAKNTLLLVICWIVATLAYNVVVLNISNLSGNPFTNFMWLSLAELPAYIIGKYSCDRIGRRWTHFLAFAITGLSCVPLVLIISDQELATISLCLAVFIKFAVCFSYYAVNLHAIETYPTCCRQTGVALGMISANAFGIFAPYIVFLGTRLDVRYPYMILIPISVCGLVGSFLPETLYEQLPETLSAAQNFGADQTFWSIPKRKKCVDAAELEKLQSINGDLN